MDAMVAVDICVPVEELFVLDVSLCDEPGGDATNVVGVPEILVPG